MENTFATMVNAKDIMTSAALGGDGPEMAEYLTEDGVVGAGTKVGIGNGNGNKRRKRYAAGRGREQFRGTGILPAPLPAVVDLTGSDPEPVEAVAHAEGVAEERRVVTEDMLDLDLDLDLPVGALAARLDACSAIETASAALSLCSDADVLLHW